MSMNLSIPMNDVVCWDPNEGTIGVVGLAPLATADFYMKLVKATPARKDWQHVRCIVDSNPKIPSRGRHLELGETDPSPYIRQTIVNLQNLGADVVAVPCNTAHILYDRYTEGLRHITPNMINITVEALMMSFPVPPKHVVVFSSRLTRDHGLYAEAFAIQGVEVLDVGASQDRISEIIEAVKQNKALMQCRSKMLKMLSEYPSADGIVLGCTELSLLINQEDCNVQLVDSNDALARYCLRIVKGRLD